MTDKKAQLQKAIITNNMELVREFYEYIFSEPAPKTINSTAVSSHELEQKYILKMKQAIKILSEEETVRDEEVVEPIDTTKPVKAGEMQFISSKEFELPEDSMPNYAEAVKKLSTRKKSTREPYRPRMVECASCSRSFDYNKEYPAGQLESGADAKIKCNNCRAK